MRVIATVLFCSACASSARRVQTPSFQEQVKDAEQMDLQALAKVLLASSPSSAFAPSGPAARPSGKQSSAARSDAQMSTNPDAPIKLGVNGFGRIGRQVVRIAMDREAFVLKHINSPMSPEYMKYLLNHDTVHGRFDGTVEISDDGLIINGLPVSLSATRDPTEIPWKSAGVEYVCESTGAFTTTEGCLKHIESGAKKVIISAPAKDADTPTIVVGVNTEQYESSMQVVSCASCTTNGLAPLVKVINEKFGIKQGLMTTVHAATASQLTVDGSMKGKDWRAGRAASANIIPSSTGAAKAVAKAYPVMKGKLTGMAFRVPTVDVSVVDLTCELEKETTYEDIKAEVKLASETYAKGVVGYTEDQVVSSDFIGETCSTVFDAEAGIMLTPTFVKLVSWYDNEWGYSTRLVDLVGLMAAKDGVTTEEKALAYFTARQAKPTTKRAGDVLMRNRITFTPQRGHEFDEKINQLAAFLFRFASPKAVPDEIDFLSDLNCKDEEFEWYRQITEEFFQVEFTDEEAKQLRNCGVTRSLVKDKGGHIWPEGLIPELGGLKGEGYKGRPEDAGTGKLD